MDDDKAAYMTGFNDFPSDQITEEVIKSTLDGAQDGAIRNVKGKLLTSKEFVFQKTYAGREFTFEVAGGQARARVYFSSEGRLYQTVVFGPEKFVKGDEAKRFLDSFRINEKN